VKTRYKCGFFGTVLFPCSTQFSSPTKAPRTFHLISLDTPPPTPGPIRHEKLSTPLTSQLSISRFFSSSFSFRIYEVFPTYNDGHLNAFSPPPVFVLTRFVSNFPFPLVRSPLLKMRLLPMISARSFSTGSFFPSQFCLVGASSVTPTFVPASFPPVFFRFNKLPAFC